MEKIKLELEQKELGLLIDIVSHYSKMCFDKLIEEKEKGSNIESLLELTGDYVFLKGKLEKNQEFSFKK